MKKILCFVLAFVMILSLTACGKQQPPQDDTKASATQESSSSDSTVSSDSADPAPSDSTDKAASLEVLKVGVNILPKAFDPGTGVAASTKQLRKNVFDTILTKDDNGELVSNLCASWKNIDERTWEFQLKEGITFQNGDELTAEDIEYTIERCVFGDRKYFGVTLAALLPGLEDVKVIDKYSFQIIMENPDPVLLERLSSANGFYVVPKNYIEEVGNEAFGQNPIGTGPYKITEISPNRVVLEYYDGFYGEKPVAERIEFYNYPELATRLTALFNNEIDMAIALYPENVKKVEENGLQVDITPVDLAYMLCYNSELPPMDDPLLRKAMNLSIDRKAIVESLWLGMADLPNGYNMKGFGEYYIEDFPDYEYDVEKAKELLAQSNYNGEEIYYELVSNYYILGNEMAEAICSMWQAIGINALVRYADKWDFSTFHVHDWSNGTRFDDPASGLWLLWGADTATQKHYWQREDTWTEYEANAKTLLTSFDFDERYAANRRMMELWEDECVGTDLFHISDITAFRQGLIFNHGNSPVPDFRAEHLQLSE